jgi:hypothetical protein
MVIRRGFQNGKAASAGKQPLFASKNCNPNVYFNSINFFMAVNPPDVNR